MATIDVIAIKTGHCKYLREAGAEFQVEEKDFNSSWMQRVSPVPAPVPAKADKPAKAPKAPKQEPPKQEPLESGDGDGDEQLG